MEDLRNRQIFYLHLLPYLLLIVLDMGGLMLEEAGHFPMGMENIGEMVELASGTRGEKTAVFGAEIESGLASVVAGWVIEIGVVFVGSV